DTHLRHFVEQDLLAKPSGFLGVKRCGQGNGLDPAGQCKQVKKERWDNTTVSQVMRPLDTLHPVTPNTSAGEALEVMGREHLNQLPVVSDGHLDGVITFSYLVGFLRLRHEFQ